MNTTRRRFLTGGAVVGVSLATRGARAAKNYEPGVSDTEIKIGHAGPYSGNLSAYSVIGTAISAYWNMVNAEGGINGRRVNFISYDDGFSPPKTVEVVRKLVEEDQVLLIFQLLGTATNTAVHKYLNQRKVPQLFVASGASKWGDPENNPWTMGWQPDYSTEAGIYAKHILMTVPDARIGILWQNDDAGKDSVAGLMKGLGKENEKRVSLSVSYEATDPTVHSQIIELKSSGANIFSNYASPKFAAQAIRKIAEIGWRPVHYLANISASVNAVLRPAGLDASQGIITAAYLKDPTDRQWESAPDFIAWKAWMTKYNANGNLSDSFNAYAYAVTATMHEVLKRCGDELTRANVMRQAASMRDLVVPMLLPGIKINTSATDFYPIQSVRLQRFKGETWELFGDIVANESK
jgi:branched-chain amino acid transport system substrate-binding protein